MNSAPNRHRLLGALLVAGCCAAYAPAISIAELVHDDYPATTNANVQWPPDLRSIFTTSYFGPAKEYAHMPLSRPLVTLSFALERGAGLPVRTQKWLNWLWYLGCCLALCGAMWAVMLRLGHLHSTATVAGVTTAALFAVHPTHVSVVMSLAYRTESAALLFVCLATWLMFRNRTGDRRTSFGAACALAAALLCKESALCALAPWTLLALALRDRKVGRHIVACALMAATFIGWRSLALGGVTVGAIPLFDNPLAATSATERAAGAMALVTLAAQHLAYPFGLSPDYSFDALQMPSGWTVRAALGVLVSVATAAMAALFWRREPGGTVAVVWTAAFWAPVANLLFPIPVLFADRLLFGPSVGACALLGGAAAIYGANGRVERVATSIATAAVVLVFSVGAVGYSFDWTDDQALYRRGVIAQPRSVKMRLNYGLNRLRAQQPSRAVRHLEAALKLAPRDHDVREAVLVAYAQTSNCAGGKALADRIVVEGVAPRRVREAMLGWALKCRQIGLANELGRGLGLQRKPQ